MRLIESFDDERKAMAFYALLRKEGIDVQCEGSEDAASRKMKFSLWIVKEDDVDRALNLYEEFSKNPLSISHVPDQEAVEPLIQGPIKANPVSYVMQLRMYSPLTRWLILICVVVFVWNSIQQLMLYQKAPALVEYFGLTSLQLNFLYDEPAVFQKIYDLLLQNPELKLENIDKWPPAVVSDLNRLAKEPVWKGFYEALVTGSFLHAPLFTKIKEGQLWRLISPCILHANLLHILFNMLWLWVLGREVEMKVGKLRYLLLMIIIGIISNTFQYLASGPVFYGFSGIVTGLAGFIWVREKSAPWEGYSIPRGVLLLIFIFVWGMLALQVIAFAVVKLGWGSFSVGRIANTAHVVGLLCGMLLAKIPFCYRLRS